MKQFLLFFCLLCSTTLFAQDIIVKKDGSKIVSKIISINLKEIKYKQYNNLNGPIYSISKKEVLSVKFDNGNKETSSSSILTRHNNRVFSNTRYVDNPNQNMISQQNNIYKDQLLISAKHWRSAGQCVGTIFLLTGIGVGIFAIDNTTASYIVTGSGVGLAALTYMICGDIANKKIEQAEAIASIPLLKQEFEIGNSRLSAGVNVLNDKVQNEKVVGLSLALNF